MSGQAFLAVLGFGRWAGRTGGGGCGEGAADDGQQFLQVERLGQVFEGAALGGLDRGHQRGLGAHDDHAQLGADAPDAGDEVEPVLVRHDDVGDDEVAFAVLDPAPERRGVAGAADLVAGAAERLGQDGADRAVVVGDEHGGRGHQRLV